MHVNETGRGCRFCAMQEPEEFEPLFELKFLYSSKTGAVKDITIFRFLSCLMTCSKLHFLSHVELGRLGVLPHLLSRLLKAFLFARSCLAMMVLVAMITTAREGQPSKMHSLP